MSKHVLVAGASGVVGFSGLSHFASLGNCRVTAISRRAPLETRGARFISVDLADTARCAEIAAGLSDVTHVIYAALHEEPGLIAGWREQKQIAANDRMLRNLLDPLEASAKDLAHVALLQGTKAYGAHVRPIEIPAREDRSEIHEQENFYWQQENYLREKQKGKRWAWTILRPQIVFGGAIGAAMNLIPAIGAWAALRREEGKSLPFPGGANTILEAVDADLLARAIAWAGDASSARNQIFNVTNGDVFVWRNVWPVVAEALGMEPGEPEPESIAKTLSGAAAVTAWDRVRAKYALASPPLPDFLGESHHYADFCLGYGIEAAGGAAIVSTVKLRQAGFHDVTDTEAMFRRWFTWFQEKGLLPPRRS
jgi:nucleoside-diphosphate-sugar epimerase